MRDNKTMFGRVVRGAAVACATLVAGAVHAAAPGILGTSAPSAGNASFDLTAAAGYTTQPDGASIYTWGYGCNTAPGASLFVPATIAGGTCGSMQLPGPTLIVHKDDIVTVTLHNNLPPAAGNTSMLFPGFTVQSTGQAPAPAANATSTAYTLGTVAQDAAGTVAKVTKAGTSDAVLAVFSVAPGSTTVDGTVEWTTITLASYQAGYTGSPGVLAQEAVTGGQVTYTFKADVEGTHSYYSGTQGDIQIEMGMYGALIVLPNSVPTACTSGARAANNLAARGDHGQAEFRLAAAAFSDNAQSCYDREYLFQFSEMDSTIHKQVEAQAALACNQPTGCLNVQTEPYHAEYFMVNGRSMPDDMDPNYASQYPHQPYNGNPHMHPGEITLVRIIGQGRMEHPFHEHANHVRVLARDGYQLVNGNGNLDGPLLFTTTTTPGMTLDGLFEYTGKNLGWDMYGHHAADASRGLAAAQDSGCGPANSDANGFNNDPSADNYYEWCADHDHALESKPFGNVGDGGPITLPDPNILVNGAWYGGSPYLGPDATGRAVGGTPIPPSGTIGNDPTAEAGFAYMWHSHNEREITTNNIFPGGMMMMMLVDPWVYVIDEAK
jgi:FtsP/CotA-like multicopper oxidase with cupredoxin domain